MLPAMAGWSNDDIPDQSGRTILITGANSGLGIRCAEALAAKGAHVVMACRNEAKAQEARRGVAAVATGPEPTVVRLDLSSLASVRTAADEIAASVDGLDVLMNNAGVMAVPGRSETADGFELQFGTNHLGHFALTGLLLPMLAKADTPRVVTTSSNGHKAGRMAWDDLNAEKRYGKWRAYFQSKLANLLFMFELDRRAEEAKSPLVSVGAHPGYAATHLTDRSGARVWGTAVAIGNRVFAQSDARGALPQLFAATMPEVQGGDYYGPDGMREMRGDPTLVKATSRARDEADAAALWQLSERLTGVTYPW
jgi:NAD(P)-dependent dehydrogenase (short-subunit alcohol dehydrogenase family)